MYACFFVKKDTYLNGMFFPSQAQRLSPMIFIFAQALIRALSEFQGGVLLVSHDEHLITAVCDELWIIRDHKVHQSKVCNMIKITG